MSGNVLILAEHDGKALSPAVYALVTAAHCFLPSRIDILLWGADIDTVAAEAVSISAVSRVLTVDNKALAHPLAEDITAIIYSIADSYAVILSDVSNTGKSVVPRLAAKLDVQPVTAVTDILSSDTVKRSIYSGNALATVQIHEDKKIMTVLPMGFEPADRRQDGLKAEIVPVSMPNTIKTVRYIESQKRSSERPPLTEAKRVVVGGVSLGSKEDFEKLLFPLADRLGAAIGATRNAVDAGFAPIDSMIGQTGKTVAPELYIGVGVAGVVQHVVGMRRSKVIVAINSNPDAAIFNVADYGLVGDMFAIIPELTDKIKD